MLDLAPPRILDLVSRVADHGGAVTGLAVQESPTEVEIALAADLLFAFDSAELTAEARARLVEVAALVEAKAQGPVRIDGHTDSVGDAGYNQSLSERRAEAVRAALAAAPGLERVEFAVRGHGEADPVAPNQRPDGADDPGGRQRTAASRSRSASGPEPRALPGDISGGRGPGRPQNRGEGGADQSERAIDNHPGGPWTATGAPSTVNRMGSPRPLPRSGRALGAGGLAAAGALVFALGVHLGTQGLPTLSGSGRFDDVTTDQVALVAPPPALPQTIPFGSLPALPLSDDTARALLDPPGAPAVAVRPVAAPAGAGAAPAPATPSPLAGIPVAPAPVVLPDPVAAVPEILPEPDPALPAPLPTLPQLVTLVGGLLSLPIL